jgi:hypothetical protein
MMDQEQIALMILITASRATSTMDLIQNASQTQNNVHSVSKVIKQEQVVFQFLMALVEGCFKRETFEPIETID